jgi:hypothetical protein
MSESWELTTMKLQSEFEATCPCCQATLIVDANLRRIVRHEEPVRGDRPELSDAHRLVAQEAERRESLFQKSVAAERTRGDALSKRFEEALRQAKDEPITKPARDFDLD